MQFKFSYFRAEISNVRFLFAKCLFLISFVFLSACSKGQPAFDLMNEDAIPRPTMEKSYTKEFATSNKDLTFNVNGECHPKVTDIKATVIGSNTAQDLRTNAADVIISCNQNQKFSFTLKSLSALGFTPVDKTTYEVQLQSVTSAGLSKPSFVLIRFDSNAGSETGIIVTSGSKKTQISSTGYSASFIRVSGKRKNVDYPTSGKDSYFLSDGKPNGWRASIGVRNKNNTSPAQ